MTDFVSRVAREPFMPDTIWRWGDDGWQVPVHRAIEPDLWAAMVASDEAVVTQVDDGRVVGRNFWPTSSSTATWLMRRMLDVLKIEPGMRVLEIGTGTGFNAACVAEADAHVVSMEIDADLAEHARRIVVPYTGPAALGALLALDVRDGVAEGRAVGEAAFMPMRGQRMNQNGLPPYKDGAELSVRVDRDGTHVAGPRTGATPD